MCWYQQPIQLNLCSLRTFKYVVLTIFVWLGMMCKVVVLDYFKAYTGICLNHEKLQKSSLRINFRSQHSIGWLIDLFRGRFFKYKMWTDLDTYKHSKNSQVIMAIRSGISHKNTQHANTIKHTNTHSEYFKDFTWNKGFVQKLMLTIFYGGQSHKEIFVTYVLLMNQSVFRNVSLL